ncbi:MAG: hypothetical protein ACYTGI_21425 [Planctomycetota bacterium]
MAEGVAEGVAEGAAVRAFEFGPIAFPLLLAPYAASVARSRGATIMLGWPGVTLTISPGGGLAVEGDMAAVTAPTAESAHCRPAARDTVTPPARQPCRAVETEAWNRLSAFAHRMLAPATEASRLAGAGARLTDND